MGELEEDTILQTNVVGQAIIREFDFSNDFNDDLERIGFEITPVLGGIVASLIRDDGAGGKFEVRVTHYGDGPWDIGVHSYDEKGDHESCHGLPLARIRTSRDVLTICHALGVA
jgi:hypothetical protein